MSFFIRSEYRRRIMRIFWAIVFLLSFLSFTFFFLGLITRYGGKLNFVYSSEEHWNKDDIEFPPPGKK
jgi:hypothetical protein